MAKISTYSLASPVTLSDIIIGSDVINSNVTKNFEVADILALANNSTVLTAFVPYTGATGDVQLGTNSIYAADGVFNNSVELEANVELILDGNTGNSGDVMLSQGVGNTPIWGTQATLFSGLVPYTGATGDVNLGIYGISARWLDVYTTLYLGEDGDISLDGDTGSPGDIILSQGAGVVPIWQTQTAFFANAVLTLPTYASNAAALAGGLIQGQLYASAAGVVSIVL
jgi:hypothetical protein